MFTLWRNVFFLVTVMWLMGLVLLTVSPSYKVAPIEMQRLTESRGEVNKLREDSTGL